MRRLLRFVLAVPLAAFAAVVAGIVALEIAGSVGGFPETLLQESPQTVEILDRNGNVLRQAPAASGERARRVALADVSPRIIQALLAAEDGRFFAHHGVDYLATARGLLQTFAGRPSGGSTLSQQLAKVLRGRSRRSLSAKWAEAVLALRLERHLGKRRILEEYLNRAPFGPRHAGVEAAAWWYFGKPASRVSLAEAALLAALPKGPVHYDPRRHPDRALRRRAWVLKRMETLGLISAADRALAAREPLQLAAAEPPFEAPHFALQIPVRPGETRVRTTLDLRLQRRAQRLVRRAVEKLRDRGGTQAAAIVLENRSGEVLAYVGSAGWNDPDGRNDGVRALRQPGSALKPFAYALAFEGDLTPASLLLDVPAHFTTPTGEYSPRNYDGRFHGPVLAREALANSYNVPAVRVAHRVSPEVLLARLRAVGFESLGRSDEHYGLGLVLGNGEVTLFELARAYLALARGGVRVEPVLVRGGPAAPPVRVFSEDAAYLVAHVLADPHARRAAFGERSALELPFPAAVKTGTSTDFRDNWTVGFTTEVTVAVWVGSFSGTPMRDVSGVSGAAPLWNDLVRAAMEGRPHRGFLRPGGIVTAHVCPHSGALAGPHCGGARREVFRAGTAPATRCSVHVAVDVDVRTGLLAGPDCPAQGRRRVLGERWPAELSAWAAAAGRPLAPARFSPHCPARRPAASVRIASPRDGEVLVMSPDLPRSAQRLPLEALVEGSPAAVRWIVDGRVVAVAPFPFQARWRIEPGEHEVVAEAGGRRSDPVRVVVRE